MERIDKQYAVIYIDPDCKGAKVIHYMTDQEERDYHDNYW